MKNFCFSYALKRSFLNSGSIGKTFLTDCWRSQCTTCLPSKSHLWAPISIRTVLPSLICGYPLPQLLEAYHELSSGPSLIRFVNVLQKSILFDKEIALYHIHLEVAEIYHLWIADVFLDKAGSADFSNGMLVSMVAFSIVWILPIWLGGSSYTSWKICSVEMLYFAQSLTLIRAHSFQLD